VRNASEQFEARLVQTEIAQGSNSILLAGMQGSKLPVVVAHGEGRAEYTESAESASLSNLALSYIDYQGKPTERYPANPNGSPQGVAGLTNDDGRVTIMMPHPERNFRSSTNSWRDQSWGEFGPWMRMFRNARVWVD
jgi:phosphoribosylformylglycinamidine synthase